MTLSKHEAARRSRKRAALRSAKAKANRLVDDRNGLDERLDRERRGFDDRVQELPDRPPPGWGRS